MPRFRSKAALGGAALALAVGIALAQERPESILPPGFNEQQPTPAPPPAADRPAPRRPAPGLAPAEPASPLPPSIGEPLPAEAITDSEAAPAAPPDPQAIANYELPPYARRSIDQVGIIGVGEGGVPANGFGRTDGRFLEALMSRLKAPLPSRWLSIMLRRTLASSVATPAQVNGADFAAERVWLLVKMGESQVARALIQQVDADQATPKLYEAAMQAALASADPGLMCPLIDGARPVTRDRAWVLADAICAGLSGVSGAGTGQIRAARRTGTARGIDLLLAEKLVGLASNRRAVTIEWDGVDRLTAWRYGLATAGAVTIPDALIASASPRVQLWRAQAGGIEARARVGAAEQAAAQGVLSSAALVDLYGEVDQGDDSSTLEAASARDLRAAYADPDRGQRLSALRQLWDGGRGARGRYARLVLTAYASAALPPSANADADPAVASMLSAGLDREAARWRSVVGRGTDAWAMATLAERFGEGRLSRGDANAYRGGNGGDTAHKRLMFVATLAGLDRLDPNTATDLGVDLALSNSWTRAIDAAAARGEPGTVVLLAAVGMQTPNWHGVSAEAMYHIIAALHRVGLDSVAAMIGVEALTRL